MLATYRYLWHGFARVNLAQKLRVLFDISGHMRAGHYPKTPVASAQLDEERKIMPNAIDLLKTDHNAIQAMLEEITETCEQDVDTRQQLLTKISRALRTHVQIEEEIFYPALDTSAKSQAQQSHIYEGAEEFWSVEKRVLPDLEQSALGSAEFTGWVEVLKQLVARHTDEEQGMFAAARERLSNDELETLGATMEARRQDLLRAG